VKPVALTCGEPSGIGPEIAIKARAILGADLPFFVLGDPRHFDAPLVRITAPEDAPLVPASHLPILPHDFGALAHPGSPDPLNAAGVIEVIARAVAFAQAGQVSGICTAPISKKALKDGADFAYPGHTEYLAALAGVDRVVMMLASPQLRVVPTTIHIPLADVPAALTLDLLEATLRITHDALIRNFGIPAPRIAVSGLNPHAGEGGTMGRDETRIVHVLDRLRTEGMVLTGPLPADTMFHPAARACYDAAVCMYHDQALIPIKTIAFDDGVNVTLGLPFIRTSPDHGTAFDIAGKGMANPSSLVAALRMAAEMGAAHGND